MTLVQCMIECAVRGRWFCVNPGHADNIAHPENSFVKLIASAARELAGSSTTPTCTSRARARSPFSPARPCCARGLGIARPAPRARAVCDWSHKRPWARSDSALPLAPHRRAPCARACHELAAVLLAARFWAGVVAASYVHLIRVSCI